ncbi:MAG: DUF2786 domain-containing protein [Acidimicrobiales bacterium]
MSDTDPVLRRVRALLDQAESTPFPSEAETFAAKAAELMARHRIDLAMVDATRGRPRGGIVEHDVELGRGQYVRARLLLLGVVADAYDCRLLSSSRPDGRVGHVIGHVADVEHVALLYTSLLVQATRAAAAESVPRGHSGVSFRRAFLVGFAHRVGERLAEHMADAVRDGDGKHPSGSAALVLADRRAQADDWVAQRYGRVGRLGPATPVHAAAAGRGVRAGDRADIGTTPVGGTGRALSAP